MNLTLQEIAFKLNGTISGHNQILCPGPGHSKHDRSLSIKLATDAPDGFIVHSFAGDSINHCRDYVKECLGIRDSQALHHRQTHKEQREKPKLDKTQKVQAIWKGTAPISGTLAEAYLRNHRGIILNQPPNDLRFSQGVYNHTTKQNHPAMVAAVRNVDRKITAVHCTFLDASNANKIEGAGVKPKLMFGTVKGGAIQLVKSRDVLALTEGIEDALSIIQMTGIPCWALGSLSGYHNFIPPRSVTRILVCADNDVAGYRAAFLGAARLDQAGLTVNIISPVNGAKDWNEDLQKGGSHD